MKIFTALELFLLAFSLTRAEPPTQYTTTFEDIFVPPPPPSFDSPSPSTSYGTPSSGFATLSPSVSLSSKGYDTPSNSFGTSSSGFGTLSPSVSLSSRGYNTPSNSLGPSSSGFGIPSSRYGAPTGSLFSGSIGNQYHSQRNSIGQTTAVIFNPSSRFGTPSSSYGTPSYSSYEDNNSEPANYEFSYNVEDAYSGNDFGHREGRQGDDAWGSYYVLLPDGRKQIVEYTADQDGYKPKIRYEDTGRGYGQGSAAGYSY